MPGAQGFFPLKIKITQFPDGFIETLFQLHTTLDSCFHRDFVCNSKDEFLKR